MKSDVTLSDENLCDVMKSKVRSIGGNLYD